MANILSNGDETVEFLEQDNLIKVTLPIRLFHRGGKTTIETPTGAIDPPEMKQLQVATDPGTSLVESISQPKISQCESPGRKGEGR